MAEQMSVMDTNSAGGIPVACPPQVNRLLDSEKTSAALFFSGLFLGLVGLVFTTLGWQQYNSTTAFDWTLFLGPILITIGGTFMLTSVCRYGVVGCVIQNGDMREQTTAGQSFTLNHQIMLHNAVVCIPPPYNFVGPEVGHSIEVVSRSPPVSELPPQYDTLCTNNRREAEEGTEENSINRSQKSQEEGAGSSSPCESPPAYEDIYPSLH